MNIMNEPNLYVDDHIKIARLGAGNLDDGGGNGNSNINRSMSSTDHLGAHLSDVASGNNNNNNHDGDFELTNKIALNYIWPTVPIGFLLVGTVANLLSIIVFRRREMKKFSSFCYFFYLNCVNLAFLYVTMVRVIGEFNFKVDIRSLSLFTCKVHVFLTYFLGHLSSLLLCTISIDRVISVMFIHRAKLLCTPRVAAWVTLGLVVFNFALSSHFLIFKSGYHSAEMPPPLPLPPPSTKTTTAMTTNAQPQPHQQQQQRQPASSSTHNASLSSSSSLSYLSSSSSSSLLSNGVEVNIGDGGGDIICEPVPHTLYADLVHKGWKIIDMSIYAFIPFAIMLICSVIIIARVAQQSKKFKKNKKSTAPPPVARANRASRKQRHMSEDLISTVNIPTTTSQVSSMPSNCGMASSSNHTNKSASNAEAARMSARTRNLALMLIPVNFLFLTFLAPVVIAMYTHERLGEDKLTLAVVELLSYCNFTFNFFIYFLTSSKFRDEFFKFVDETCKCRLSTSSSTSKGGHSVTTVGHSVVATAATTTKNGTTAAAKSFHPQRI